MGSISRFLAIYKSVNDREKNDPETAARIHKYRKLDNYDLNQRITILRDFDAEKEYNRRFWERK